MDCVTASDAGVAGSSPTWMEQKFVPFSFIHNPPYLYSEGKLEQRKEEFINHWKSNAIYNRFYYELYNDEYIDKEDSNIKWLSTTGMFSEIEGLIMSIQDQVEIARN